MTTHLDSFVRVSVVLGLALLAMPLFRRHSASARRLVLSAAFASALVVPFLPAWRAGGPTYEALVGRLVAEPSVAAAVTQVSASPVARSIDWLAIAWAAGALVVAARFVAGHLTARRIARRAEQAEGWDVRVSSEIDTPFVFGILAPVVVVPTSSSAWSDERKRCVLVHERAHVEARDLAVQVLVSIACSLHWWNPLAWLAARRLRLERELAADEAVLRSGVRASSYAEDLLAFAGSSPSGALAIGQKPLASRIVAILAERRPSVVGPKRAAALVAGTAAIALACGTASESTSTPPKVAATDRDLQAFADAELRRSVAEWNAKGGTIIVMSPKGELYAEAGDADRQYVTGSTIKTILLAAAIDEGAVKESDVFDCTPTERLHDATPLGRVALPEILAASSNVGFAQVFGLLGADRYDRALRRFHFATPPQLDALTAIGATMSATPRQVTTAYAALANGGDGIVQPSTAARVSALLENVVTSERGTGRKAAVSGVRVAGKTGSSEWGTTTYASFVGWVPAGRPRYVIFVGIESPSGEKTWAGEVAAPIFSRVAAHALAR